MLAVACAGLLISRLGSEVAQSRWQQLSLEEQQRLKSSERWSTSLQQLNTTFSTLLSNAGQALGSLKPKAPAAERPEGSSRTGKRWVRPEPETEANKAKAPEPTEPDPKVTPPPSEDG